MKKLKTFLGVLTVAGLMVVGTIALHTTPASAVDCGALTAAGADVCNGTEGCSWRSNQCRAGGGLNLQGGVEAGMGDGVPEDLFDNDGIVTVIINVLLFIVGVIAVIMLIVGGIKYSTSAGDSAKVTSAKNTIMYAIVGLVVAILAFAVVNFVVGSIGG